MHGGVVSRIHVSGSVVMDLNDEPVSNDNSLQSLKVNLNTVKVIQLNV